MTNDELHSLVLRGMAATKPKGRSRCVSRRGILVLVAALTLLCLLKPLEIYSGHKSERVWEWTWLAWSWALVQSPGFPSQEGLGSVKTDGTGLYLLLAQHTSAFGRRARASLCSALRSTRWSTSEFKAQGCLLTTYARASGVLSLSQGRSITGRQRCLFLEWVHRLPSETTLTPRHTGS